MHRNEEHPAGDQRSPGNVNDHLAAQNTSTNPSSIENTNWIVIEGGHRAGVGEGGHRGDATAWVTIARRLATESANTLEVHPLLLLQRMSAQINLGSNG